MLHTPAYVRRLLAQARQEGQWYEGQADAAALCFDALALQPDRREAAELVYKLFCDEWLIYDMRTQLQRDIEEWDDRPWRQRRRLAYSFCNLSRWDGWDRPCIGCLEELPEGPPDVAELLEDGGAHLLFACWVGDEHCIDLSGSMFGAACRDTADPHKALLWVGKRYAEFGFFADAAETLGELCSRFDDDAVRRLLAEVRWWRDHAHRLAWLPPDGDGSRYNHLMSLIDPTARDTEEMHRLARAEHREKHWGDWRPIIDPDLADLFASALPPVTRETAPTLVDWSFLDIDQPCEPPEWVKERIRAGPQYADIYTRLHRFTRPIDPPATPARRVPNAPPFEPDESFDADDDFDDEEEDS